MLSFFVYFHKAEMELTVPRLISFFFTDVPRSLNAKNITIVNAYDEH